MWRLQSAEKNLMVVALLCVKQALVRGLGALSLSGMAGQSRIHPLTVSVAIPIQHRTFIEL